MQCQVKQGRLRNSYTTALLYEEPRHGNTEAKTSDGYQSGRERWVEKERSKDLMLQLGESSSATGSNVLHISKKQKRILKVCPGIFLFLFYYVT